jgi:hypothetical protein
LNADNFSPFTAVFDPKQAVRVPEQLQTAIASGVSSSRASFDKATEYTKANLKTAEKIVLAAQTSSKEIGEKVLGHAETNAKAAFEAAATLARAKTFPELARLQANFIQQQLSVMHGQSQELFQLSAQLAQQTFATINSAVTKNFEQFKKNG